MFCEPSLPEPSTTLLAPSVFKTSLPMTNVFAALTWLRLPSAYEPSPATALLLPRTTPSLPSTTFARPMPIDALLLESVSEPMAMASTPLVLTDARYPSASPLAATTLA
ncbi:hypothetical protein BG61_29355 [Caballeronia glathei]|uniref:Uncharacterized protein n=1 Tax=Caballeronia glathei TaxID=60547 RepID=A0A069PTW2_9BURK|nr:hypothetical protein BG61_29355 [Caballeronia glathei]